LVPYLDSQESEILPDLIREALETPFTVWKNPTNPTFFSKI